MKNEIICLVTGSFLGASAIYTANNHLKCCKATCLCKKNKNCNDKPCLQRQKSQQTSNISLTINAETGLPKLYVYDHCPFCTRARMIFGLKKIKFQLLFLANDDEETPISLVGSKQVPILEMEANLINNDKKIIMPESMDIVKFIDENYGSSPLLAPSELDTTRQDLKKWMDDTALIFRELYHPRFHANHLFPEFAFHSSREYYRLKKEKYLGNSFAKLLAKSPELIEAAEKSLVQLCSLIKTDYYVNEKISYDDIDLFGKLRGLTIIKNLKIPEKIKKYMDFYSTNCDIPLFDTVAKY